MDQPAAIAQIVEPRVFERAKGFVLRRVLANTPSVGPFILFDHYGTVTYAAGQGLDIGPHPHIGMATLSYLFEGSALIHDSMGGAVELVPGGTVFMVAGRGCAHSERTPLPVRQAASSLAGVQLWLALPEAHEEDPAHVEQYGPAALPVVSSEGCRLRVVAGRFGEAVSPVGVLSPACCYDVELEAGARLTLPGDHPEVGVYVLAGDAVAGDDRQGGERLGVERLSILRDPSAAVAASTPTRP